MKLLLVRTLVAPIGVAFAFAAAIAAPVFWRAPLAKPVSTKSP